MAGFRCPSCFLGCAGDRRTGCGGVPGRTGARALQVLRGAAGSASSRRLPSPGAGTPGSRLRVQIWGREVRAESWGPGSRGCRREPPPCSPAARAPSPSRGPHTLGLPPPEGRGVAGPQCGLRAPARQGPAGRGVPKAAAGGRDVEGSAGGLTPHLGREGAAVGSLLGTGRGEAGMRLLLCPEAGLRPGREGDPGGLGPDSGRDWGLWEWVPASRL